MQAASTRNLVMERLAAFLAWDFLVLESGQWPAKTFGNEEFPAGSDAAARAGERLAGALTGCFAGMKGDRKSRKECHRFSRSYLSTFICERCMACQLFKHGVPEFCFGDATPSAGWRNTEIDNATYLATAT
eukprot:15192030-Alexandrium_andersonii.AAC.1